MFINTNTYQNYFPDTHKLLTLTINVFLMLKFQTDNQTFTQTVSQTVALTAIQTTCTIQTVTQTSTHASY